jgi:hypothetical protein
MGSSPSLGSLARIGTILSIVGVASLGSSLAALDFLHLVSGLSLRSLSISGSSRMGSLVVTDTDGGVDMSVVGANFRSLNLNSTGGALLGEWTSEEAWLQVLY